MALTRTIKDKLNIETYYRLPSCDMHHGTHSGDNAVTMMCVTMTDNDESNDSDHALITVTISLNQYIMQE